MGVTVRLLTKRMTILNMMQQTYILKVWMKDQFGDPCHSTLKKRRRKWRWSNHHRRFIITIIIIEAQTHLRSALWVLSPQLSLRAKFCVTAQCNVASNFQLAVPSPQYLQHLGSFGKTCRYPYCHRNIFNGYNFFFIFLKMGFNGYIRLKFISSVHEDRAFLTWELSESIWSASSNSLFAWCSSFNFSLLLLGRKWERSCRATPHLNKAGKGANISKRTFTNSSYDGENMIREMVVVRHQILF